jgi:hypothetical protein
MLAVGPKRFDPTSFPLCMALLEVPALTLLTEDLGHLKIVGM